MNKKLITILAAAAVGLSACSYANVGPGYQAVVVDGYWMIPTDPVVKGCISPEKSQNEITNQVFQYPARQISFDATGGEGSERGAYEVTSNAKEPARLGVPVVFTFDLTTDCEALKRFHKDFATKYVKSEGKVDDTPEWVQLLNYVIGQPAEVVLSQLSQKYTWREIWNDEKVRITFQEELLKRIPEASKQRTNGEQFFENFQVLVTKPWLLDQELQAAITREQQAIADAKATEAKGVAEANAALKKAEADVLAAEAETKVAQQQALQKQAIIAGFPSVDAYLKALCIERNCNPFQPVIVPQP